MLVKGFSEALKHVKSAFIHSLQKQLVMYNLGLNASKQSVYIKINAPKSAVLYKYRQYLKYAFIIYLPAEYCFSGRSSLRLKKFINAQ